MVDYLLVAITVAFLASATFFLALGFGQRVRLVVLVGLALPILLTPLLIPAEAPSLRFLASIASVTLLAKLWDVHFGACRGSLESLWRFLVFLPNLFSLVLRKLDNERRPTPRENFINLAWGLGGTILGTATLMALFRLDWEGLPFALEHTGKVSVFGLMVLPVTVAAASLWRLSGGVARDSMDHPLFASTPADFWRRYNRPVQQFFYEDVFKPVGGLRSPVRATLLVFALSAIIHEYVFDIAVGQVQGYQAVFFMVQGSAVVVTMRLRPKQPIPLPWIIGTILFNLATSVFFFASMNGVVRFYARSLPGFLRW